MSTESTSNPVAEPISVGPTFGRRLAIVFGRMAKAFLKLLLFFGFLAGVGFIVFLLVQELRRSFDVVNEQVIFNRNEILRIGHDLGALEETVSEQTAVQNERLANVEIYIEEDLAEELTRQSTLLTAVELQLAQLISQTASLEGQTSQLEGQTNLLNEGVLALQGDINSQNGRLDGLGGELDALALSTDQLGQDLTALDTAVDELPLQDLEQMRQVVSLFRIWEMISRARLRLLENNAGLAATDVSHAVAALEAIVRHPNTDPALLSPLALVQARLTLADAYLPENPTLAALDLENSWRELDAVLATLLDIPLPETAVEPSEGEATPTATATPTGQP